MKVEVIPEPYAKWPALRCQHDTVQNWPAELLRRKPYFATCKHTAVVRVDGKPMCRIHAGFDLLTEILNNRGGEI